MKHKFAEYIKKAMMPKFVGNAFTRYNCERCGKEGVHQNTGHPPLCDECLDYYAGRILGGLRYDEAKEMADELMRVAIENEKSYEEKKKEHFKNMGWTYKKSDLIKKLEAEGV